MKWNLIIMLLYSFMSKLQNSPNQNTKRTKYKKMKWNLIIMLLYSFMWKLQNSPNQNTKRTKYKKWNETWLLCFYTHSCSNQHKSFKIVQIKIQKGQSIRNEMKWNLIIMLLYSFISKLQKSPNQNTKRTEYEKWNEINLIIMLLYSFMWKLQNSPNQNTKGQSMRNEMKYDYYAFILIHVKASK